MTGQNVYDVTAWPIGNPYEDIGEVINSMLADVKARQRNDRPEACGRPGAVIYLPPGDYRLRTQVKIDMSFIKIVGSEHGFISSSIRYNLPEAEWPSLHEVWPGGSRVMVELPIGQAATEAEGAAFLIDRVGEPRISSVTFENFCLDGLHFSAEDALPGQGENSYVNGKTGIYVACAQDSFRITGMGMVYLEHAITIYHADALSIHDNFLAECGSCVELRGWGQASKVTDNFIGAGYKGHSIFAQNFGGLLIAANNIFPRGKSSVYFDHVSRSSIANNRFHAFYPGMLVLEGNSSENLVSSNHFLRDSEPWAPMKVYDNGLRDDYGLMYVNGRDNTMTANHISITLSEEALMPRGTKPVIIRIALGSGNYVAMNHIVPTSTAVESDAALANACFSSQVDALTRTDRPQALAVIAVLVGNAAHHNIIVDTCRADQALLDATANTFRPMD